MSQDRVDENFLQFDRYFASKMIEFLSPNNPIIPKVLLDLIRPKEFLTYLTLVHNFGDIIPYLVSIVFRVNGFQGTPHMLSYQIPLKVGVVEV